MEKKPTIVTRIFLPKPYDAEYIASAFKSAATGNGWMVDALSRETDIPAFCVDEYHYGDGNLAKDIRCKNAYSFRAHIVFGGRDLSLQFGPMVDNEKRYFIDVSLSYGGDPVEPESVETFIAFWDAFICELPPF